MKTECAPSFSIIISRRIAKGNLWEIFQINYPGQRTWTNPEQSALASLSRSSLGPWKGNKDNPLFCALDARHRVCFGPLRHKNIKGPVFSRHSGTAQIHVCPPSQWYFCSNRMLFSFWPHLVILAPFPVSFFKAAAMEVVVAVVVLVEGGGGEVSWVAIQCILCMYIIPQSNWRCLVEHGLLKQQPTKGKECH